ncbi:transposable element Tcb1 transposase [Trichonephila clavipes]|nr:transposable element Tcb1 transposase [Trichonephila clavipes]
MWSMIAQRLTQITPPAATPDQLWQRVDAAWSAIPQEHIQSLFESMLRRVAAVISNDGGYSCYRFWQELLFTEVYKLNHLILGQDVIYKLNFVVLYLGVALRVASSIVTFSPTRNGITMDSSFNRTMSGVRCPNGVLRVISR